MTKTLIEERPGGSTHPLSRPKGAILWFTGLSGAGKSTLTQTLAPVIARCHPVELLDGDEMRRQLCRGLGYSREDRDENVRRLGWVARLLARHGVFTLVAAISPYRAAREAVRAEATAEGITFLEIHADAAIDALVERDVKGLYRRAIAGELAHFTGISDPYERPVSPELIVHSDRQSVSESVEAVLAELQTRGLLPPSPLGPPR